MTCSTCHAEAEISAGYERRGHHSQHSHDRNHRLMSIGMAFRPELEHVSGRKNSERKKRRKKLLGLSMSASFRFLPECLRVHQGINLKTRKCVSPDSSKR